VQVFFTLSSIIIDTKQSTAQASGDANMGQVAIFVTKSLQKALLYRCFKNQAGQYTTQSWILPKSGIRQNFVASTQILGN
jgi:hypothetical protein